jgi:hypothetical protein
VCVFFFLYAPWISIFVTVLLSHNHHQPLYFFLFSIDHFKVLNISMMDCHCRGSILLPSARQRTALATGPSPTPNLARNHNHPFQFFPFL